jgi:hypothetical protein
LGAEETNAPDFFQMSFDSCCLLFVVRVAEAVSAERRCIDLLHPRPHRHQSSFTAASNCEAEASFLSLQRSELLAIAALAESQLTGGKRPDAAM